MASRSGPLARPRASVALAFAAGIAAMASLAACEQDASIPGTALPAAIASFASTPQRELDAAALAAQAVDGDALAGLLDAAGFRAAVERTYTGSDPALRRVEVLLARFASEEGAERYLAWQRDHVSDVIGEAEPSAENLVQGTTVYVHQPDGCCAKEQVTSLATWRTGSDVFRVLMAGPDADGPEVGVLLSGLMLTLPLDV